MKTVLITNQKHPHANEIGSLTGKAINGFAGKMAEIKLNNCPHGIDKCFVKREDVQMLN